MNLHDPLKLHFRLDKKKISALSRLSLFTVHDLIHYFPNRYSHVSEIATEGELVDGEHYTLYGVIKKCEAKKSFTSKVPMTEASFHEMNGRKISIKWLNQAYISKMIVLDKPIKITGPISNKQKIAMFNPEFEHVDIMPIDTTSPLFSEEVMASAFGYPVYSETKDLSSKWVYHTVKEIFSRLGSALSDIPDIIPEAIRTELHLPPLSTALIWIHTPQKKDHAEAARKRFAFQEIFLLQIRRQFEKKEYEKLYSHAITINKDDIRTFMNRFGFEFTDSQKKVVVEILKDIMLPRPMGRLVEGDVGSGKTAVAATIAYGIISNTPNSQTFGNVQVAYMAPTEVLAKQLFTNFISYFKHLPLNIVLLTGSTCLKFPSKTNPNEYTPISKAQAKKWIKNGEIAITIGTHALTTKSVDFKHLGLVIVDEQHRFGTNQRMKLAKKEGHAPHFLSMTATPIPRTLALTIYGDLDLSIIDSMPPNRKPVVTEIVLDTKRDHVYEHVRNELKEGRQIYVICPRIDEPDPDKEIRIEMKSVTTELEVLKEKFKGAHLKALHSKHTKIEKESIMQDFYDHKIDILVSTTVIEVGVSVANATTIIIEGAERFGLSQLHQLRGRVIRGTHQGYCFLVPQNSTKKTKDRLHALKDAKNGFELAEKDLQLRGPGDITGVNQSGISDLAMEALKNLRLVEAARANALIILNKNPTLALFPALRAYVESYDKLHLE